MPFLSSFELIDRESDGHLILERFNYLEGQYPVDKEEKIVGFPDKIPVARFTA